MLLVIIGFGSANLVALLWLGDTCRRGFAELNNRITELAEIIQRMDTGLNARIDEIIIRTDETNKNIDELHRDHNGIYR